MSINIGILIFPSVQQLDVTGPFEVFAMEKRCSVHLVWKNLNAISSATGLTLSPTVSMGECPRLDVLVVPGGRGINVLLEDEEVLDFVRNQSNAAQYLCSVCTGALVLGAAGLLRGKRAATHWMAMDMLPSLGATPIDERIVWDDNIVTAGGVTSGIDFALFILSKLFDIQSAEVVQLYLEYSPAPPFHAGHPSTASPEVIALAREAGKQSRSERERIIGELVLKNKI